VVYQLKCNTCSATYIGKTCRQACRRLKEHGAPPEMLASQKPVLKRSARIAANAKLQVHYGQDNSSEDDYDNNPSELTSAVQRHIQQTKHVIDWRNWKILDKDKHPYRLLVRESMAIVDLTPNLNATTRSTPLIIYPTGYTKRHNISNTNRN
jgi:hypothetical protein